MLEEDQRRHTAGAPKPAISKTIAPAWMYCVGTVLWAYADTLRLLSVRRAALRPVRERATSASPPLSLEPVALRHT